MSWIKVRTDLTDNPHVIRLANRMKCPPYQAMGAIIAMWAIADGQTTDGVLRGWDADMLDARIGMPKFTETLALGLDGKGGDAWVSVKEDGTVVIPDFSVHMGESAKARALAAKRQANLRGRASNAAPLRERDASVTGALPREEKRREEKKREIQNPPTPLAGGEVGLVANPTKPRREPKPKQPTHPGHAEAKAAYVSAFEAVYHAKPPWGAREAVTLNAFLASLNGDSHAAAEIIARYFADSDPFVVGSGHSLGVLVSRAGRYVGRAPAPRSAGRSGGSAGEERLGFRRT
jgi:hypothetical protein